MPDTEVNQMNNQNLHQWPHRRPHMTQQCLKAMQQVTYKDHKSLPKQEKQAHTNWQCRNTLALKGGQE